MTSIMANSGSNLFDKLCDTFGNFMTMEQIAEFALTSKVILSYKIDFLNSFHDQLVQGLWKKSSNGCIYPLDNRYEKILYVEINEDYEADVEKSLEKLRNFSTAHKVFDEMQGNAPEAGDIVEAENAQNDTQTEVCQVLGEISDPNPSSSGTPMMENDDHTLLELPVPDFILEMALAVETTRENQESTSAHQVFDIMPKPVAQGDASQAICDVDTPSEVLDAYPVPQFIMEMAQLDVIFDDSKFETAEMNDGAQGFEDTFYLSCEPDVQRGPDLEYRRRMFAKLASLDDPFFCDFIVVGANIERFSTLTSVIHGGSGVSNLMLRDFKEECSSIFQVKTKAFIALNETRLLKFVENVVGSLFVTNIGWFMGTSLSMVSSVEFCKRKCSELSIISRHIHPLCHNSLTLKLTTLTRSNTIDMRRVIVMVPSSDELTLACCPITYVGIFWMESQNKFFDPGINVIELVNRPNVTLEDKGVFRGEEEKVNEVYTRELCNVVVLGCKCMSSKYCVFGSCDRFGISSERCCPLGSLFLFCQLVSLASFILAGFGMLGPIFQLIDLPYNILNGPWKSIERNQQKEELFAVTLLVDFSQQHFSCWPLICAETIEVGFICGFDVAAFCLTLNRSKIGKYHVLHCETAPYKSSGPQDIEALLRRPRVKRNEATNDDFFAVEEMECFDYSIVTTVMITIAEFFSELEGYTFNFCEDVTPKLDVMFWCMWPFNLICIKGIALCSHVFDPGGKRLEVIRRGFAGVGCNGFFCVGIDGLNNRSIMLRTDTSLSKLLKENLRVAIQSFRLLIVIYIFDPGGSLVALFCNVLGIIACLIFDP